MVSDGAVSADNTDSNLVNPWGISFSSTGPFWVSDNGTGVSTLYNSAGQPFPLPPASPLVVLIPPPNGSLPGTLAKPTGQVFNNSSGFVISAHGNSGPALFIFATEDGTLSGWNPNVDPTNAILMVDRSTFNAVYKGLAISSDGASLYAANFHDGTIEKFDNAFNFVSSFNDPRHLPSTDGFAPFNIQTINGQLYVTYAKKQANSDDDESGPGNGFIDVFDDNGTLVRRFAGGGSLNSPWGLVLAPANFGQFSNALLVGNFGDGRINAFAVTSGDFLGQLKDTNGNPIEIDGLWALVFGNGGNAGNPNELFFTAGINDEANGLFGKLEAVAAP